MQISVVIPSYNSQAQLPDTLAALRAQKTDVAYEVVVVDCSEGDAVESLCRSDPKVVFHKENKRFNPGEGRNIGARIARGQLLVFVDSDVVLEPGALEEAYRFYQEGKKIFGGALELNVGKGSSVSSYFEHFFFLHEYQRGRKVQRRSNLSSALLAFERETFLRVGGFKDIPRMQDTELTERLVREGFELYFNPHVVGLHTQEAPFHKVLRKIFINGKNLYFIRYQDKSPAQKMALAVLLPVISSAKTLRIIMRNLRYQAEKDKLIVLGLAPLLSLGGMYWMAGFYQSLLFGGGISTKRD
jgi:glycosyltransferase involved in cell wall biosynthesis